MTTGKRLKDLRKKRGLNQSEVGEIVGLSYSAISAIEQDRSEITSSALKRLSEFFEVSTDFILTGKEGTNEISAEEREIIEILRQDDALTRAIKEAAELKKKVIRRIRMAIEPERLAA